MSVYQQIRSGDYVLIRFELDTRTRRRSAAGRLISIPAAEMKQRGIELVLAQLQPRRADIQAGCELFFLTPAQRQRGETRPQGIALWQEASDELVLQPIKRGQDTNIFVKGETFTTLPLPADNREFMAVLNNLCSTLE